MGKGEIKKSMKEKINTRSYTEEELVAENDVLSHLLWTRNLLIQKGYNCDSTLRQDNTSAILLETNGMESYSKSTHHINMRFYFIKDHIIRKELNTKQCSTDEMLADFPSNPLQGRKFNKFKIKLMIINA